MNNKLSIIAIIQARMGSKRFPGKIMYPFAGRPSIGHLLDSVMQVFGPEDIFIASSSNDENVPLWDYCSIRGIRVYRGDEENVASRFFTILKERKTDYFVRLSADSPLLDHRCIEKVISKAADKPGTDIISTAFTRKNPSGMNVELIKTTVFTKAYENFSSNDHFEHVTKYFYENPDIFSIETLNNVPAWCEECKFSFDTEDDRRRIEKMFDHFEKPHYEYTMEEKCKLYSRLFRDSADA